MSQGPEAGRQKPEGRSHKAEAGKTVLCFLCSVLCLLSFATVADAVSSSELIEQADIFNGQTVRYSGEALGAVLERRDGAWINVSDGYNAIGIWCSKDMARSVSYLGDYRTSGDIVEVEGVFNRACPRHGGELDIHADSLKISRRGYIKRESLDMGRLNVSAGVFLAAILLIILFRKRL